MDTKLDQIEEGEVQPEALRDLVSKEHVSGEGSKEIRIQAGGMIKIRKGRVTGEAPYRSRGAEAKYQAARPDLGVRTPLPPKPGVP